MARTSLVNRAGNRDSHLCRPRQRILEKATRCIRICVEADTDRVLEYIDEIRDRHPQVAHSLTHLVDNFQFEQLIQATQTILNQNSIAYEQLSEVG